LLTKRTYSKHTYLIPLLLIALALPAVALAAPGSDGSPQRIGLADAQPAALSALTGPVRSFHQAIRVSVHRIRAVRRARLRRERREVFATLPGGVSQSTLDAIGACESGGDPTAVSSDGSYRGKYQFDYGTWASVGGSGDPAAAPEREQDYRAALLYAQSGSSPWPICG
jgi:Transglycosylase-like domain